MIDRRLIDLIKHLVTEQTTNLSRLESSLNLTRRQVTYILDKLNDLLVENQLPTLNYKESTIEITKGHHNFLVQTLGNSKILADYLMNSDERLRFLFLLLVALDEDYLSLADFLAILKVSKTTVLVDLKKLEKILGKRGIRIVYSREKGYELEGNELAVRNLLFDWLTKDISEGMSQIYDIYLSQFKRVQIQDYLQLIQTLRQSFSIELVESRTIELAYFIVLILNRLKRNLFHEEAFTSVNLLGFAEYKFIETLLTKLEVDDTREVEYLTALILGQSVGNRDAISPDRALILNLTKELITNFERLSGIQFLDWSGIIKQIYSHLRPTYYRLLFYFPVNNLIAERTKAEYPSIFYLVKKAMMSSDGLKEFQISEEEVAFLTMHFAALLTQGRQKSRHKSIKAAVVCTSGIGSSALLLADLQHLFAEMTFIGPMDIDSLLKIQKTDFDIIFSATSSSVILQLEKPIFIVNPVMTEDEEYHLVKRVYERVSSLRFQLPLIDDLVKIIGRHASIHDDLSLRQELSRYLSGRGHKALAKDLRLKDVLKSNYISVIPGVDTIEDVVKKSAQPLLNDKIITREYLNRVLRNLANHRQNYQIAPGILLPHARPEGVNQIGLSFVILDKSIDTSYGKIGLVIFLAAVDNTQHLLVMKDLLKLLSDANFIEEIRSQKSSEDILNLIQTKLQ